MAQFKARRIKGPWISGFVLDLHTLSSILLGYDEFGYARFDTTRSEIGELLYRLKNRNDRSTIPDLVEAAEVFVRSWNIEFSAIVAVPPPKTYRTFQPVLALAAELAKRMKVPLLNSAIRKAKDIPELKNVFDQAERRRLLEGASAPNATVVK